MFQVLLIVLIFPSPQRGCSSEIVHKLQYKLQFWARLKIVREAGCAIFFSFFCKHHVYSPAHLVIPFQCMPSFLSRIGFSIPAFQLFPLVDFHRIFANSRSRPFRSSFFLPQEKVPNEHDYTPWMIRTRTIDFSKNEIHLLLHRRRLLGTTLSRNNVCLFVELKYFLFLS